MDPKLPKGTRDYLPAQVLKRKYIFNVIERIFSKYGYDPIETPSMEVLETLTGKYGEEGDRLLFKILNNGDYLKNVDNQILESRNSGKLIPEISKRGLRYDLTVPFARFVSMHRNDLSFPFKRYQIQPVWRADKPQKGRYQEFYQCDADVVGSDSLLYEAECTRIYDEVFAALKIPVLIKLNNRKILAGIADFLGINNIETMTITIDKMDKIGRAGVRAELEKKGLSAAVADKLMQILSIDDLATCKEVLKDSEPAVEGIGELENVFNYLSQLDLDNKVVWDITLARGLSYYTGCILEVLPLDIEMGSVGGGGRYADLTSIFGVDGLSGVGISFGAERIYDIMEAMQLFPPDAAINSGVLIVALDNHSLDEAFSIGSSMRNAGLRTDIYPDVAKMKKQMKYANRRQYEYVIIIGDEEVNEKRYSLKNMATGNQIKLSLEEIIAKLKV